MTPSLVVTADDTTGALETAALLADAGWKAGVRSRADDARPWPATLVDLRSRHLPPADAAERLATALAAGDVRAHKIDSTLRGAWPEEVLAAVEHGRRVVLVPANPLAGRTCVGGVVRVDGVVLDRTAFAGDPRSAVRSTHPASLLPGASELGGPHELPAWLQGRGTVAVVDASSMVHVHEAAVSVLGNHDVLLAGPAPVVAALGGALAPGEPATPRPGRLSPPLLVVCGSAHPASRRQLEHLERHHPGAIVVSSPTEPDPEPTRVLGALAAGAHRMIRSLDPRTVVLVGGDTAGTVLGDADVAVGGSLDVGVAWGRAVLEGVERTVVSKPGGFGDDALLTRLVEGVST